MIYDPLIDDLAALPLTLLVKAADNQHDNNQTACFCPICKGQTTPHFIIYKNENGGVYGRPMQRWSCTKTKRSGYGAIELMAAILNISLEANNLKKVCKKLADKAGYESPILENDFKNWDFADQPQKILTVGPKTDFTPQELEALGCKVSMSFDGKLSFGFGTSNTEVWQFQTSMINKDFNIYSITNAVLPAKSINGEMKSRKLISTPFNPLFVCYADKDSGCIFAPCSEMSPIVFSNTEANTVFKVQRWLGGDATFVKASEIYETDYKVKENTGVVQAINILGNGEQVEDTKMMWDESEDGKAKYINVDIEEDKRKVNNIIYCDNIQDAIATYYHLNVLRYTYPNNPRYNDKYYHVAFTYGDTEFAPVHHRKLARFANRIYTLFENDKKSLTTSRMIGRRYRDIWRASLPQSFYNRYSKHWMFNHTAKSARDFFMCYRMMKDESVQYDHDINILFCTVLASALTTSPFERKVKRNKSGQILETYYVIDPATLWEFMAGEGYMRDVQPDSSDTIGRFIHMEGPSAKELNAKSMVSDTRRELQKYAGTLAKEGTEDFRLMLQAIARAKEISEQSISAMPSTHIDYKGGYGPDVEHFYYNNGALRITKDAITFIPYEDIDFYVDMGEKLEWDFQMPFTDNTPPFIIEENPEYQERLQKIEAHAKAVDEKGRPEYTLQQIGEERSELMQWARMYRWNLNLNPKNIKSFNEKDLWPVLKVIRGFANERWEKEEMLKREGSQFGNVDQAELDGHFVNLVFCLGRILWRYHGSKSNCIPYLMENTVENERKASGGSGKSSFINVFAACAAYVLRIDAKNIIPGRDFTLSLSEYKHHHHRIVHWEDWGNKTPMEQLYNYATSGFAFSRKFENQVTIAMDEAPSHVISSNYPPSNTDDSTMRRICIGGFSHRFCGENSLANKTARPISLYMPDFNTSEPKRLNTDTRNQIAYICALAVQFVMKYDEKVEAPQEDLKYRALVRSLGESFVHWAQHFFAKEEIYGTPIDIDSAKNEYVHEYADASESKNDKFSRKAFRDRINQYCQIIGVCCNPQQIFINHSTAQTRGYFKLKAWITKSYFTEKEWLKDNTVFPKQIRELERSESVVFFYRSGKDVIPDNYDELKQKYKEFIATGVDPLPIRDEDGNIVYLTEEEILRLRDSNNRKQGKSIYTSVSPPVVQNNPNSPLDNGMDYHPTKEEEDLPF